jgi:hypothetical protein
MSQNSEDQMRVFSGGLRNTINLQLIQSSSEPRFEPLSSENLKKSVTNTATLNVKNLRVIVSIFGQNTKNRRSRFASLSSLEPANFYPHCSTYSYFCFRSTMRRISAKGGWALWCAEHIENWDETGRGFVAQTKLYGKTVIKVITDRQVCCLLWYADSCTQHPLQCNLTYPEIRKSIMQLAYYHISQRSSSPIWYWVHIIFTNGGGKTVKDFYLLAIRNRITLLF